MIRSALIAATLLSLILGCVSCALFDTEYPDREINPDVEVPQLINSWQKARESELNRGDRMLASNEIRRQLERIAFEYPEHVPSLLACGIIAFEMREFESSARYLDRVFELEPMHPGAAILRSRIALAEGNTPYARRLLEEQIQMAPDDGELRAALAAVARLENEYDEARAHLESARRLGADEWRIAYNQGLVEEAAGNRDEAIRMFTMCLELNPEFRPAQSRLNGIE